MDQKTYTGVIYAKNYRKHDGTTFEKLLLKINAKTYEVTLSKVARKSLAGYDLPVKVTFDRKGHFVKDEYYTTKDGEERSKPIVVILEFLTIEETEFESKTLDSLE